MPFKLVFYNHCRSETRVDPRSRQAERQTTRLHWNMRPCCITAWGLSQWGKWRLTGLMWGWSADKGTRGGRTVAAASCFSQHPDCLGARAGATLIFQIPEGYLHTCSEWGGGETDWKNIRIWTHKPTDWRCKGLAIKTTLSKLWCIHRSDVTQAEEQAWAAACTEGSNACVGTPGREASVQSKPLPNYRPKSSFEGRQRGRSLC